MVQRLQIMHRAVDSRRKQHIPEKRVTRNRVESLYQRRIEPAPRTQVNFIQGGLCATFGMKDINHLGKQGNTRINGNLIGNKTVRMTFTVVMFIKAANTIGNFNREPQQTCDLGAALATR